jgi:hypothetical protein
VYEHAPGGEHGEVDANGKEGDGGWKLVASEERAHARMILDACWLSGGRGFATAGRDKMVCLSPVNISPSDVLYGYTDR